MQIGFFSLLFLIFLTLKLTEYVAWSWWIVCLPLYAPLAVVALVCAVLGVCIILTERKHHA